MLAISQRLRYYPSEVMSVTLYFIRSQFRGCSGLRIVGYIVVLQLFPVIITPFHETCLIGLAILSFAKIIPITTISRMCTISIIMTAVKLTIVSDF